MKTVENQNFTMVFFVILLLACVGVGAWFLAVGFAQNSGAALLASVCFFGFAAITFGFIFDNLTKSPF